MKKTGALQKTPLAEEIRKVIAKSTNMIAIAEKVDHQDHKKASEELIQMIRSIQTDWDNVTRAVRRKQWDIDKGAEGARRANKDGEAVHNEVNY